jgi:hypothetical protein
VTVQVADQLNILLDGACLGQDLPWKLLQRPLGALDVRVRVWFRSGRNAVCFGRARGRQRTLDILRSNVAWRIFGPVEREVHMRCTFSLASTLVRLRYRCTTCLKLLRPRIPLYRVVVEKERVNESAKGKVAEEANDDDDQRSLSSGQPASCDGQ